MGQVMGMPHKEEPKRCSHCGGYPAYGQVAGKFRVWCKRCFAATNGYDYLNDAIANWNSRVYQYRDAMPFNRRPFANIPDNRVICVIGTKEQLREAGLVMKGYGKKWLGYPLILK